MWLHKWLAGILIIFQLMLETGFAAPRVKKSDETKKEEKKKSDANILYKVNLSDGTERSKIYNYSKKRVKFSSESFSQPVRKYDVFLVLNDDLDGVLAEVVVVKVKRSKKIAYAKKSRIQESLKFRDLVGKTVIRLDDLGDIMGSMLVYRRNPVVDLSLYGRSMILSSANVATGIELDPQILTAGAELTLFAPGSDEGQWLNWLGYRFSYSRFQDSRITIKTAKTRADQGVLFSGDQRDVALIFQPWFEDLWIYQATVMYGLRHEKKETITFIEGGENGEDLEFVVAQKAGFIGLGLGINPVHNLYGGLLIKTMASQDFSVSDSSSDEEKEGKWSMKYYGAWASWIHALTYDLKVSVRFDISLREDTITKAQEIGSGNDHKITDWERNVKLGIQYAP